MSLVARNVSAIQTSHGSLIHNLSLEAKPGTIALLIGAAGSGKTSILETLAGLHPLEDGSIRYQGVSLWNKAKLREDVLKQVGIVLQSPERQLFLNTGEAEFRFSLKPYRLQDHERNERIRTALHIVQLPQTVLGMSPTALSAGQKRRLAIATVVATKPRWFLLDEPTAGLDETSASAFLFALTQLVHDQGVSAVIATHDLDRFLPIADQVLFVRNAQIIRTSSAASVAEHPEWFREANVGLPTAMELAMMLQDAGVSIPDVPLDAAEFADRLRPLVLGLSRAPNPQGHDHEADSRPNDMDPVSYGRAPFPNGVVPVPDEQSPFPNDGAPVPDEQSPFLNEGVPVPNHRVSLRMVETSERKKNTLDIRAKWFLYTALSTGWLLQTSWMGLAVACVVSCLAWAYLQRPWRMLIRLGGSGVLLTLISGLIAGLRAGVWPLHGTIPIPIQWSWSAAGPVVLNVERMYGLLLCSVLFTQSATSVEIKNGLMYFLSPLNRGKMAFFVDMLCFVVSLVFRFIPLLMEEFHHFRRAAIARGKRSRTRLRIQDIGQISIPLIFSLMDLGDNTAATMELRGFQTFGQARSSVVDWNWAVRDTLCVVTGISILALLYFV